MWVATTSGSAFMPARYVLPPTPRHPSAQQLPGHHHALDLVGPLVDLSDLGVPHHALDRVVAGVAVATEELDRVRRDPHRGVGGEALGGRTEEGQVGVVPLALPGGGVHELPG